MKADNFITGSIDFQDPWFVETNGSQPNNWHSYNSPFTPGSGNYLSYGGVFLNQGYPNWAPPYYSVSIPSSVYLPQTGKTHNLYFQNWSYSGATLQYPNSTSTPVTFTNSGATVTANLKGTQLSDNTGAIAGNGQRKIVRTGDGTMHMVYESMGHVWYERSLDNGATWDLVNAPSPIDTGGGKCPTIDFLNATYNQQNYNTYYVVILFQQKYGSNYKLKALVYRKTDLQELFQPYQAVERYLLHQKAMTRIMQNQ